MKDDEISICIRYPLPEEKVFRSKATEDILSLLVSNPHQKFSVSELKRNTEYGSSSTMTGIETLKALDLIKEQHKGKKRLISINRERLDKPDDPLFAIPQESFREPVRQVRERLMSEIDYLSGLILFGSVAQGKADRRSDIDLLLMVEEDLVQARQKATDISASLQEEDIEGERYSSHILVESVESVRNRGKELENIFIEGITLYHTKKLEQLKEELFHAKQ